MAGLNFNGVSEVNFGGTDIKQVYLGSNLLWEKAPESRSYVFFNISAILSRGTYNYLDYTIVFNDNIYTDFNGISGSSWDSYIGTDVLVSDIEAAGHIDSLEISTRNTESSYNQVEELTLDPGEGDLSIFEILDLSSLPFCTLININCDLAVNGVYFGDTLESLHFGGLGHIYSNTPFSGAIRLANVTGNLNLQFNRNIDISDPGYLTTESFELIVSALKNVTNQTLTIYDALDNFTDDLIAQANAKGWTVVNTA